MLPNSPIKFDAPVSYRIIVQGVLSEIYYPYFEGMEIVLHKGEEEIDSTTIIGNVKDQAALSGILNMLYDFHYPILSVEYIGESISETK